MQHLFKTKAHDLKGLFDKVDTLSKFTYRLEKQALIDPLRYDSAKYVGDGFEFFIELFLSLHPADNRVGVYNYTPIMANDNGVDGVGVNIRNEPCVVQVKYRSNKTDLLTANKDHLSNMFSDGMLVYNVVADTTNTKNYRHFVFTTADGLHHYTDQEMYKSKVKCFGYNDIRSMIDHNYIFWNKVREIVDNLILTPTKTASVTTI
jgi:hypothetical protein